MQLRLPLLLTLIALLTACASGTPDDAVSVDDAADSGGCEATETLLADTSFTQQGDFANTWRMVQHIGEPSFALEVVNDELEIRRIGTQPWMLFHQTVKDPRLSGATIRYAAELKGDLPVDPPLHGFDHLGGLFLKLGKERGTLAEHDPNAGQWDWRSFSIEKRVPNGVTSVQAGFVHQAGGSLWVRSPSLVILDCN